MSTHPSLIKAQELRAEADRLDRSVKDESDAAQKKLSARWSYKVVPFVPWKGEGPDDGVIVIATLENGDDYAQHLAYYGTGYNFPQSPRRSVVYFRSERGVLKHSNGGWHLLEDAVPISEAEWVSLKAGNIEPWLNGE